MSASFHDERIGYSNYKRKWWHFTDNGVHDPKAWDIELK